MKLIVSDNERRLLIEKKVLGISTESGKEALFIPDIRKTIEIELEDSVTTALTSTKPTLEEFYLNLRKEFPTDTLHHIFGTSGGINLRQGKKESILKSLKELSKEYTEEQIIMAAKYEVLTRTNRSKKSNKDELEYMKRLGTWVNDTTNIDAMLERMLNDNAIIPTPNVRHTIY